MNELIKNIETGIEKYTWKLDSPLKSVTLHTECKLIFDSVCEEIGRFYSQFEFKTTKRKLQVKFDDYTLKIQFSSSSYNQKGNYVWLEINSGIYPKKLVSKYKTKKERLLPIIFSNTNLLDEVISTESESNFITKKINILGEETIVESKFNESTIEYSRGINLYKISIGEFKMIIRYINRVIKKSIEITTNKNHLICYLVNPTQRQLYWINEKRIQDYIELYYPNDNELIKKLRTLKLRIQTP